MDFIRRFGLRQIAKATLRPSLRPSLANVASSLSCGVYRLNDLGAPDLCAAHNHGRHDALSPRSRVPHPCRGWLFGHYAPAPPNRSLAAFLNTGSGPITRTGSPPGSAQHVVGRRGAVERGNEFARLHDGVFAASATSRPNWP